MYFIGEQMLKVFARLSIKYKNTPQKILSSKHSDFYYYLTTNGVLDLPLFAVFCRLRSCQACF